MSPYSWSVDHSLCHRLSRRIKYSLMSMVSYGGRAEHGAVSEDYCMEVDELLSEVTRKAGGTMA